MAFKLRSGNISSFKNMGSSPAKHFVDDVPEHNDGHSDDLQTPEEHEKGKVESPAKQTLSSDDTTPQIKTMSAAPGLKPKDKYWYKINNKPATKAEYIKYQNKPGGDEPGKQTNNPDVYGYKAARKKARAKLKTKK